MHRNSFILVAITSSIAFSQPVEYRFDGIGSGSLAGVGFTDVSFEIILNGDLADITTTGIGYPLFFDSAATFSVNGIGSGAFLVDISIVRNLNTNVFVLGDWTSDSALAIMDNPEFVGYDLTTPFGPVTDFTLGATSQFADIGTTAGGLSIQQMSELTFQAGVPTPGTLGLIALGGVACMRRRR